MTTNTDSGEGQLNQIVQLLAQVSAEAEEENRKDEYRFLERLKLEFDANVSQEAGERWADSDAADMVNERLLKVMPRDTPGYWKTHCVTCGLIPDGGIDQEGYCQCE